MPACYPVPTRPTLEGVLGTLVASPIKIQLARDIEHGRDTPGVFAEYVDDREDLCVLAFANHVLVNLLGGALVDTPQNVVEEATSKFVMNEGCLDGFREIANVLASSLNSSDTPHVRFRELTVAPGGMSEEVKALWRDHRARRCYSVAVARLGQGALILYLG